MKVRFQYTDWSEWEGSPEDAGKSPDKGVVRMYAITDDGRQLVFVYEDFYYLHRVPEGWLFGAGTPRRDFIYSGGDSFDVHERPVLLPKDAVVRQGETVSQEEAVKFGLIGSVDEKELHLKRSIPIERRD